MSGEFFSVYNPLCEPARQPKIPLPLALKNSRIWKALFDSFHYLLSGPLCGAPSRYLVFMGDKTMGLLLHDTMIFTPQSV